MSEDLESRVESSLSKVMRDAFPNVQVTSWSSPEQRQDKYIGIKVESGVEEIPETEIHQCEITIEASNLESQERELMRHMLGNAYTAKDTIMTEAKGQYRTVRGQPVEVMAAPRTAEEQKRRLITYQFSASLQPTGIHAFS